MVDYTYGELGLSVVMGDSELDELLADSRDIDIDELLSNQDMDFDELLSDSQDMDIDELLNGDG